MDWFGDSLTTVESQQKDSGSVHRVSYNAIFSYELKALN